MSCIFCKIIDGELPCKKVMETDTVLAFHDIDPEAPVHVLVVPKQHVSSLMDLDPAQPIINDLLDVCQKVAKQFNIAETGFRLVTNIGDEGCQSVHHLHFHVIGGRQLNVPLG